MDWALAGEEDTESVRVRRVLDQSARAEREAVAGAEAAASAPQV